VPCHEAHDTLVVNEDGMLREVDTPHLHKIEKP
jgi:hypothetical protein